MSDVFLSLDMDVVISKIDFSRLKGRVGINL